MTKIPKNKILRFERDKKKKRETLLEEEKKGKRRSAEVAEKILEMGQDSERKAAKVVKEVAKEEEAKYRLERLQQVEILSDSKTKKSYLVWLATFLTEMLDTIRPPRGWEVGVMVDSEKNTLSGAFRDSTGRTWSSGFFVQFKPQIDLLCLDRIAFKIESGVDAQSGKLFVGGKKARSIEDWKRLREERAQKTTPSGLALP